MPIHKINLPHLSQSALSLKDFALLSNSNSSSSNSTIEFNNNNNNNNNNFNNDLNKTISSNSSSFNLFKSSNKNLNNLNNNSNFQSSSSLQSMLTNQTATTEYSPNLIENECGDLLKIIDLDIDEDIIFNNNINNNNINNNNNNINNNNLNKKPSFHFPINESDTDIDDDYDDDINDVNNINDINDVDDTHDDTLNNRSIDSIMLKTVNSNDDCGFSTINDNNDTHTNQNNNNNTINNNNIKEKWAFVLIGLPACGKSTMVHDFQNYVSIKTNNQLKINSYNAGDIRRSHELDDHHKFNFNDLNSSQKLRDFYALKALTNLTNDLINNKIDIGILDATNTTYNRRKFIFDFIKKISIDSNIKINPLIFEIKCSNRALRRYNIEQKAKNKDYIMMNHDVAINDFLERIEKYEKFYEKVTIDEIKILNVKYFGIDNVGDTIYYDCGLNHHNNYRHQSLSFKSLALNLLYQFLITYRTNYAKDYLTNVDSFYTEGHYHPIKTSFSKPVSAQEVLDVQKVSSNEINSVIKMEQNHDRITFPKVLSSSRMEFHQ